MNEYLVVCKCSGLKEKAEAAFKIAFPKRDIPPIYRGPDAIKDLANKNTNTNLGSYLMAISKKNGQFAYYLQESAGDVVLSYDLLKGKKVA